MMTWGLPTHSSTDWKSRAEAIQNSHRIWMRNETGTNNGNQNGEGNSLLDY